MSKATIIVGGTGCGKTFLTKKLIRNVNKNALHIFDVNNEYSEFTSAPFDGDIDNFLQKANRLKNAVILIEDATSFLSNRGRSDLLTKILVAKRHTNNNIILLFHSMRAIPKYIADICTDIIIFKTNDPEEIVKKGFQNEKITIAWATVQKACKNHKFFSSYPSPKGIAPPSMHVKLYG
jgi:ABC-type cobalamin/Fe3+-siderophores transport system ATPase subunit